MRIILYVKKYCPYSLRARVALEEKKMKFNVIEVNDLDTELINSVSPDNIFPVIREKEYIINDRDAIMLYIDERFPAPGLVPHGPNDKIKTRLLLHKINKEWYSLLDQIIANKGKTRRVNVLGKEFKNIFLAMDKEIAENEYFLSPCFTLADCYMASLLLHLQINGILIDDSYGAIFDYREKLFARDSIRKINFKNILSTAMLRNMKKKKVLKSK